MRLSKLFTKTSKTPPHGEPSMNARLLEQAGFVAKLMAGVYSFLPLGFRVLERINGIIREEMNRIGGQEIVMPALQPKDVWEPTGRWKTLEPIMYQFKDHSGRLVGLGTTHEEIITSIATHHIHSYRDLPVAVYQIQEKFRDEPRAKSGLIRGRQFLMKDLYSFHADAADLDAYYETIAKAYEKIFSRCELSTMRIEASGGTFTKQFSHEFQVLSDAGEDRLVFCPNRDFAQNAEIAGEQTAGKPCPNCGAKLEAGKGIEVGNIFKLGTTFSEAFNLTYLDRGGKRQPIVMASYGISPSRLVGTIVEVHHDASGIRWPASVAPYPLELLDLGTDRKRAETVYATLGEATDILYDDRDAPAGTKLKDADLLGMPIRAVVSDRTKDRIEVKHRGDASTELLTLPALRTLLETD